MSSLSAERPTFFEGQFLGAEDLCALVNYFRTRDARHLLGHHSWGIVAGLDLVESQAPDGTLDVFVQPGLAIDGYGRLIVVATRTPLDAAQFSEAASGEVEVWIRYDEQAREGVRKGFEVCSEEDVFSRVSESFLIEIGPRSGISERQSGINVNGLDVQDAREALRAVDETAPLLCDGSVPHQEFPPDEEGALWLLPLGHVRWQGGAPGSFQPLNDEQKVRSRRKRRYVGLIAESFFAADGLIRLRNRFTKFDPAESTDSLCQAGGLKGTDFLVCDDELQARELVWLEGHTRITGDMRLFGSQLEFRESDGRDFVARTVDGLNVPASTPLLLRRNNVNFKSGADLQILLGESLDGRNRLSIGRVAIQGDVCDLQLNPTDHVVVQDDGKVGIGAVDSQLESPLTIRSSNNELLSIEDDGGARLWNVDMGPDQDALNIIETLAGVSRLFIAAGGNIGLGTDDPATHLHLKGDDPDLFLDINGSSPNSLTELRFGSDGVPASSIFWSKATGKTHIRNNGVSAIVIDTEKVGLGTDDPATTLHVATGSNVSASGSSGFVVIGDDSALSVGLDGNEIQARNGNSPSALSLQRSGGRVGIGTNSPAAKLDIGSVGNSPWIRAGDGGINGRFWVQTGTQSAPLMVLSDQNNPPRLQFQQTGGGTENGPDHSSWIGHAVGGSPNLAIMGGDFGVGTQFPSCRLEVRDSLAGAASNISSHVACINNASTDSDADVLALRVGAAIVGGGNNFITFFAGASAVGRIEGSPPSGVTLISSGADFAECLPLDSDTDSVQPGEVVGVFDGAISRRTKGADQVLVVAERSVVVGNAPSDRSGKPFATVAMIGQVSIKVRGKVRAGDVLIPSGEADGTAVAAEPGSAINQVRRIVGQAWESSDGPGLSRINCAVSMLAGLGVEAFDSRASDSEQRIQALEEAVARLLSASQQDE